MDRCDIIALRRSAPNQIRVQGAGRKVQRAHPSKPRHALRGRRDSICWHNTLLAQMKKKENEKI